MSKPFVFCFGDFSPPLGSWVTCICEPQKNVFIDKDIFDATTLKMNE
jgi:hypothetical protein